LHLGVFERSLRSALRLGGGARFLARARGGGVALLARRAHEMLELRAPAVNI
jgi:hypothetical protein